MPVLAVAGRNITNADGKAVLMQGLLERGPVGLGQDLQDKTQSPAAPSSKPSEKEKKSC